VMGMRGYGCCEQARSDDSDECGLRCFAGVLTSHHGVPAAILLLVIFERSLVEIVAEVVVMKGCSRSPNSDDKCSVGVAILLRSTNFLPLFYLLWPCLWRIPSSRSVAAKGSIRAG